MASAAFGVAVAIFVVGVLVTASACVPVRQVPRRVAYLIAYLGVTVALVVWAAGKGMPVAMALIVVGVGTTIAIVRLYLAWADTRSKA